MDYKVNYSTKLDYDSVLKDIVAVVYYKDGHYYSTVADMSNREITTDNGYPWYKGAFGNCLIALNSKLTDTLYLLDKKAMDKIRFIAADKESVGRFLKDNAVHTISRKNKTFRLHCIKRDGIMQE